MTLSQFLALCGVGLWVPEILALTGRLWGRQIRAEAVTNSSLFRDNGEPIVSRVLHASGGKRLAPYQPVAKVEVAQRESAVAVPLERPEKCDEPFPFRRLQM
jgi:hypothetical protein